MNHNPLAKDLKAKAAQLQELDKRRTELASALEWYRDFDLPTVLKAVETHEATCAALTTEEAEVTRELAMAREMAAELRRKAQLGRKPAHWFSPERRAAKEQAAKLLPILADLEQRPAKVAKQLTRARRSRNAATRNLTKFNDFSVEASEAEISDLDAEMPLLQLEHDRLAEQKKALDRQLKKPVEVLSGLQQEERRVDRERSAVLDLVDRVERDIDRASRFDRQLSSAANGYERHKIHEECEERFGDGSPRAVISDQRRKLTQAKRDLNSKNRQQEAIRRNIAKAEARVARVVERGTRDVRALVLDGSNLCYQGGTFIRFAALRPLCDHLVGAYNVTLVFDASIRQKLGGVTDRALRDTFPNVTVHVVATKTKADETILAVAEDPYVFVISNDRFSEYGEKPVVRDGRLIRHEIINGRVLVADLDVSVPFFERS